MTTCRMLALVSTCTLLAACASGGGSASDVTPLVGKYQSGPSIATFDADGTFRGTTPEGKDWVRGTYTVDGNTMTMVDTWEDKDVLTERCEGVPGRYAENDALTAQSIEDACKGRRDTVSGMAWTRMR